MMWQSVVDRAVRMLASGSLDCTSSRQVVLSAETEPEHKMWCICNKNSRLSNIAVALQL
ncbi:hypothetical protein KIN20_029109 [Parelaphostrongylus tenuis]|uniref:Uncharacterized protein n=1 Tax=Parelaphostrongylus tenuis TaxID=148309 RepID=A0AAD5R2M6_PARTN|nr:hypothetical protein KIN20_029109 [Parelaphostrongylus tenuis]